MYLGREDLRILHLGGGTLLMRGGYPVRGTWGLRTSFGAHRGSYTPLVLVCGILNLNPVAIGLVQKVRTSVMGRERELMLAEEVVPLAMEET